MNKLKNIMLITILYITCVMVGFLMLKSSYEAQEQYEIEHNCKFDYNDLCYTEQERPWLFK